MKKPSIKEFGRRIDPGHDCLSGMARGDKNMSKDKFKYFIRSVTICGGVPIQYNVCERLVAPPARHTYRVMAMTEDLDDATKLCVTLNYWHVEGIDIQVYLDSWYQVESGRHVEGMS